MKASVEKTRVATTMKQHNCNNISGFATITFETVSFGHNKGSPEMKRPGFENEPSAAVNPLTRARTTRSLATGSVRPLFGFPVDLNKPALSA